MLLLAALASTLSGALLLHTQVVVRDLNPKSISTQVCLGGVQMQAASFSCTSTERMCARPQGLLSGMHAWRFR